MKTKYIHDYEIDYAFKRKFEDAKFRIVPIILGFCRWSTAKNDLSQFTALPYTAKPVTDFRDQDMAWFIIEECLKIIIEHDDEPTGTDYYESKLSSEVKKLYQRIVAGKVDNSSL